MWGATPHSGQSPDAPSILIKNAPDQLIPHRRPATVVAWLTFAMSGAADLKRCQPPSPDVKGKLDEGTEEQKGGSKRVEQYP